MQASELTRLLALQIALEAHGYSPGVLDARKGPKTRTATAAMQISHGLTPTGEVDDRTANILGMDAHPVIATHRINSEDAGAVGEVPTDWVQRSRQRNLPYTSLADVIREKFHCSSSLLRKLNPESNLQEWRLGDTINVPAIRPRNQGRILPPVSFVEIDLERKVLLLIHEDNGQRRYLQGLLHCSIAADPDNAPVGDCAVISIIKNPNYTFDPAKWPEVKGVERKLNIPPGPRNPVGIRWIGLDRSGIGIHGTPEPENIGKTGSHGCFRLANWDAAWLAEMVSEGMPVRIYKRSVEASWSWP